MAYTSPAVVIDNGSYTTKAGFALDDLPSLIFNTNYLIDPNDEKLRPVIGDDNISKYPENEIMTLMDGGLIYNYDHIIDNWNYVYDNVDNSNPVSSKDFPLVLTEPTWNTNKNKSTTAQIVFENLEVPIFALVKTPLAQLYHMNRSTGLVIDIGSSITSVTPILDGIIQTKSSFHNKFAGDFTNLHILNYFNSKLGNDYLTKLLPVNYHTSSHERITSSFKNYYVSHNSLQDFKNTMLSIKNVSPRVEAQIRQQQLQNQYNPKPILSDGDNQLLNYQLANNSYVTVDQNEKYKLLEPIFDPQDYQLPNITLPEATMDKPSSHGLSLLILFTLKHLESNITSSIANDTSSNTNQSISTAYNKFNDILRDLAGNIVITGGGSLSHGKPERIVEDLRRNALTYFNNYPIAQPYRFHLTHLKNYATGDINNVWDKQFGSWLGASNLASMLNEPGSSGINGNNGDDEGNGISIALDNWFVTKADYEELGEDLILEKFK